MQMRIPAILTVLAGVLAAATLPGCVPVIATGMSAGALMAADRRTTGIYVEDEAIELKTNSRIDDKFKDMHFDVTSYNRHVLLVGEAPSEQAKQEITAIANSVENVRSVTNEMQVAGSNSFTARANDALITSKVKSRFVSQADNRFAPNHVKVVTENGVVYLMGIVTEAEADAAVEIARSTSGVQRVVKVFEYRGQAAAGQ